MVVASRFGFVLALGGTAFVTLAACGSRSELAVVGVPFGVPPPGDDASTGSPECMGSSIDLALNAPNLYFVLDHSSSMTEMSKWANVRQVVAGVITQIGAGARFGVTMFPSKSGAYACDAGTEVMSLRQGDVQGNVASSFLSATTAMPGGGTPTAATLEGLVAHLSSFPGTTYAILATDGGPNCNATLSCAAITCTANIDGIPGCPTDFSFNCCESGGRGNPSDCLDDVATEHAAADLLAAGVKTYVLGIPGSAAYSDVLDQVALAGGTARPSEPLFYQAGTADTAALTDAFDQIVQQTGAGCTFTLAHPPTSTVGLRATLSGTPLPASGPNGWSLAGTTLTLSGTSCQTVRTAGAPSLQFFDGCGG